MQRLRLPEDRVAGTPGAGAPTRDRRAARGARPHRPRTAGRQRTRRNVGWHLFVPKAPSKLMLVIAAPHPVAPRLCELIAAVTLVCVLAASGPSTAHATTGTRAATPSCFGAASRDPLVPCVNPALSFTAIPRPKDALLEPAAPCRRRRSTPPACTFGVSARRATSTVALIGDSHAAHWRAALAVVTASNRWRAVSIDRNLCPFTFATTPGGRRCTQWSRRTVRWLRAHPEVSTVFVSANSGSGVVPRPGWTRSATKIDGYIRAWNALPGSVREVFVIRDVPRSRHDTADCVARAVARRRNPAIRCARPRARALRPDLQAIAAEQAGSPRVKLIDLTPLMCDDSSCFPVVGGALVIKDVGHLTHTFSATLGPFLGRAVAALRAPASIGRPAAAPVPVEPANLR